MFYTLAEKCNSRERCSKESKVSVTPCEHKDVGTKDEVKMSDQTYIHTGRFGILMSNTNTVSYDVKLKKLYDEEHCGGQCVFLVAQFCFIILISRQAIQCNNFKFMTLLIRYMEFSFSV